MDETETLSVHLQIQNLSDVIRCPPYILAILVAIQVFSQLLVNPQGEQAGLDKLGNVKVTLTLLLTFLLSWQMSRDGDVNSTTKQNPQRYFSDRNQIATYIVVVFLILLDKFRGSNVTRLLFLFWSSTLFSLSEYLYLNFEADLYQEDVMCFWSDVVHILVVFIQCSLLCVSKKGKTSDDVKTPEVFQHPQTGASWLSDITLHWTLGIVKNGRKRTLEESDVWDLAPKDQCRYSGAKFEKNLRIEEFTMDLDNEELELHSELGDTKLKTDEKESDQKQQPIKARISLLRIFMKSFGFKFVLVQGLKAMAELIEFVNPILMGALMTHIQVRDKEHWSKGMIIVFSIFITNALSHIFHDRLWAEILRQKIHIRSSVILSVFKKSLKVRNEYTKDITTGEIVNLIAEDCERVVEISVETFHIISSPLKIGISLYLLCGLVGNAMFIGLFIMILLIPLNRYVGKLLENIILEKNNAKDKRIKLMNEIVNGIKVLKLYAWELSFMKKVKEIRSKEEGCNSSIALLNACIGSMYRAIPFLVKLSAFGTFLLLGGHLDPATGFVTIDLFHILNRPFSYMALLIPRFVAGAESLKRIEKFINGENIPHDVVLKKSKGKSAVSISEGEFSWDSNEKTATMRDIDVTIPKGRLVAVVGMVGSGKSSLLSAMMGEMEKLNGTVEIQGRVAYVPQEAWILNAPLRENVLFGSSLEPSRYRRVLDACALKEDINRMSAGDKTEIGEKGINLSGGQKQRVSLARAVYSNADIYLMDDPLSAVDSHVGKHIFNKVIGNKGVLQGKTRVLVTHGIHWLSRVDSIIVMKDGQISESGTYEQLISHDGSFAKFLREALSHTSDYSGSEVKNAKRKMIVRLNSLNVTETKDEDRDGNDIITNRSPTDDSLSDSTSSDTDSDEETNSETFEDLKSGGDDKHGRQIDDEESGQGQVNRIVYLEYIRAIGYKLVMVSICLFLTNSLCNISNNFVVKQWTDDTFLANESLAGTDDYVKTNWNYLMWFAITGLLEVIGAFLYVTVIFKGTYQAANRLHDNLLYRILRCPMSFFDTTPSCRIITRFSKDVTRVDELGFCVRSLIGTTFGMIAHLCMIVKYCPVVAAYLIPISIAYFILFNYHIGSIRQLRRYMAKYKSPMYVHFTETLNGLPSIRAYNCQNRFIRAMEARVDEFVKYELLESFCSLRLGIRSGFLYNLVGLIAGLACVMDTSMTAGMVGVVILYAGEFSIRMNRFMWNVTHAETQSVSLERLIEYSNKPSEASWETTGTEPVLGWPTNGQVSFNDFKARYREGLDLVLKGVNCQIESGQKVGIVGRTGAGKTSLTLAFFRLLEAADGNIQVDGEKIADIGLHDLRSRINILPQEPVIFCGSLRMNLDPFGKSSDEEMWTALKRSHMASFVTGLTNKLDFECGEGGKNLSMGQRQLLCLARTLLRKKNILVLDEATAAVDMETDELIQKTIRTEFKDSTVLTIAHRLNTIMDYDKVLVLEHGTVKEFDSPDNLLADHQSTFHSMAKDAKLV